MHPLIPHLIETVESNPLGVLDFILQTGTTGLLLVAAWLFVTGKILPASVVQKQLEQMQALVSEKLASTIEASVKEAVRIGMLEAWKEIDANHRRAARRSKDEQG
jgi:hypothetical protein